MSKRTRYADNSKRKQPTQQQRAQARQQRSGGPSKNSDTNQQQSAEGETARGAKR